MEEGITFVGMDAHKKSISVAMLLPGQKQAIEWQISNTASEIKKLARKLNRQAPGEIRSCYEAGPTPAVSWLRCFHGIDTTSAMMIVSELHDIARFHSARSLMAYLGLVPSEHSSGGREKRGSITKAGNTHLRRVLIEAAHHARHPARVGPKLRRRREGLPTEAIAIADRAHARLHRRYWRLVSAGKTPNKARVAIARELAGFIWASLRACAEATRSERQPRKKTTRRKAA